MSRYTYGRVDEGAKLTPDTQTRHSSDAVRLLAAAAGAARLYPATSDLPLEAARRFVAGVAELPGPLRLIVEPEGLRDGDTHLAGTSSQVSNLAEALYALQVGQLVIAPGVSEEEVTAFVRVVNSDPHQIRREGGARAALNVAGCQHIAVIELNVRQAERASFADLDLTSVPVDDIAESLPSAAERWVASAKDGEGEDEVAGHVDRLEHATHGVATQRIAEAIMRLDEQTRMRVLASALQSDSQGRRMEGMLGVFAKMRPAALARLLTLTADRSGTQATNIAGLLDLPPETASMLGRLLGPAPEPPEEAFAPSAKDVAAELASVPDDPAHLETLVRSASPAAASGRALSCAVAVSRSRPTAESVTAIGEALPGAARCAAYGNLREALRRLDDLHAQAELTGAVDAALATLRRPDTLRQICLAPQSDADAAIAGEILSEAGPAGAEALLEGYTRAPRDTRALLRPVLRSMSQPILAITARRLRTDDPEAVCTVVRMLPRLGDSRAVPTMQLALEHLDLNVRRCGLVALAETNAPEAKAALIKAVGHWDPTTQRYAVREIGRTKLAEAIPAMSRMLEDINPFERSHELKREIILAMEAIGSTDALPVLRRVARRRIAFGRKPKELRIFAQRAVSTLERATTLPDEGDDTP